MSQKSDDHTVSKVNPTTKLGYPRKEKKYLFTYAQGSKTQQEFTIRTLCAAETNERPFLQYPKMLQCP